VTKKPDPRDALFKRTVTPAEIKSTNDLGTLKKGLEEARDKLGYWRGKQLEPDASPEIIAYGSERACSAGATSAGLSLRIESVAASERRKKRGLTAFAKLTDAFVAANRDCDEHALKVHVRELSNQGIVRLDKAKELIICADGSSVSFDRVKDHLYRSRRRLGIK
jgi:hypothetical protein